MRTLLGSRAATSALGAPTPCRRLPSPWPGATGLACAGPRCQCCSPDAPLCQAVVVGRRPVALAHRRPVQVVTELSELDSHRFQPHR
ncbi:MAG: hypothetical protein WKG07_27840 [Hymenobacter sp.]